MRNSIHTRLIVYFVAVAILPVLIIALFAGSQNSNSLSQQTLNLQDEIASREASQFSSFFQSVIDRLEFTAQESSLLDGTLTAKKLAISKLLSGQDSFDKVYVLDEQGQEQIGVARSFAIAATDLTNRAQSNEYKIPVTENRNYYGPVHVDPISGEPVMTIGVPVENLVTGKIAAILVADVRFVSIQNIIAATEAVDKKHGNLIDVYVIDANNDVVAHSDPSVSLRDLHFNANVNEGVQTGLKGTSVILAANKIQLGEQTFTLVAETPVNEALAPVYATGTAILVFLLVVVVVSIVVAVLLANQIVKPIVTLSSTTQAIQAGDLTRRVDVKTKDEIGQLASAFNGMTGRLQETLTGLETHVADLEKARVEREILIKDLQEAKRIAEENSRLKSEFLSTMSHELRTPLNAIEGFTGIILNKMGGTDFNPKTEGYLTRIRSNSKRLLQLINDFLDLSRVEAGRLELANQPFSPVGLTKRWKDEIGILAEKKNLQFVINLAPGIPETIYGDEEAISKIVVNLLSNAIKFTEEGQIALAVERTDGNWGITVSDTGIGIPPHAREFIFDEFRQVDGTSKRKYGGTGLGLAIVQKYARAMGGTVQVKSELGKGSTFSVSLPLKTTA
jgi:signal transduction histidine kinase